MFSKSILIIFCSCLALLVVASVFHQVPTTANYHPAPTPTVTLTLVPSPTVTPTPTPQPLPQVQSTAPIVTAKSYMIQDLQTTTIIAQKDPSHVLPPASTTKIMTALVALDKYSLADIVTVPDQQINGAKVGLNPGETITVENLLYAMLMQSGNDAAWALASHYPGGAPEFINTMNQKAAQLGLEQTHFANPTGLHHPLHLSSTVDLIKLAQQALTHPVFAQIVATKTKTITDVNQQDEHRLTNLNQLLVTVPGVKGVKTGWTEQAREALVTLVEQNNHPLLIAVLASEDRFGDTRKLIEWAYQSTVWDN